MRRERTRGRPSTFVRAAAAATLAVSLAAAVSACGDTTTLARRSPAPVRIGALYDLTGSQAALDIPSLDGARLAVERLNANGGLMGRRVELLERDGKTTDGGVRRAAASLVASGVSAIVGLSDTDQVLAAAPIAAAAGIPFVTSGATSPRLPDQVPGWLFLACFGDNAQAAAGAQYAVGHLGAQTAAVIYQKDMEYTRLLARYFTRSFRAQSGTVVLEYPFKAAEAPRVLASRSDESAAAANEDDEEQKEETDTNAATKTEADNAARTAAAAKAAASADVIFVAAGPSQAAGVVRRLRKAGLKQPIIGGDSFDDFSLVKTAESTGGDVYYTTHAAPGVRSAGVAARRFSASFSAAYGRAPDSAFACLGYDAVNLVAAAIEQAESVDPAKVRDALQATRRFAGVSGVMGYDEEGGVPHKRVTVVRVGRRPAVVAQFTPSYVPKP